MFICVRLLGGVASPPVLVKAEAAPAVLDGPVKKAVPSQFPLLERVKGKSTEQLKALEESFQRSSSPTEKELGKEPKQAHKHLSSYFHFLVVILLKLFHV